MNNRGFSLIELLISMVIMIFLLMMTTFTFQKVTQRSKSSSSGIISRGEHINALELIRLDLEHIGFGIADIKADGNDNNIQFINWDAANNSLLMISTLKNSEPDTYGWVVANYDGPTSSYIPVSDRRKTTGQETLWIDTDGRYVDTTSNPPKDGFIYIGYPYDNDFTPSGSPSQPYNQVEYRLSASQTLEACNSNTLNLIRAVDGSVSTGGSPALNCIAGFAVEFAWDDNQDGDLDDTILGDKERYYTGGLPTGDGATIEIRDKLYYTTLYLLAQVGKQDRTYTYQGYKSPPTGNQITFTVDGHDVQFTTNFDFSTQLDDFRTYHWRVIKITAPLQGR